VPSRCARNEHSVACSTRAISINRNDYACDRLHSFPFCGSSAKCSVWCVSRHIPVGGIDFISRMACQLCHIRAAVGTSLSRGIWPRSPRFLSRVPSYCTQCVPHLDAEIRLWPPRTLLTHTACCSGCSSAAFEQRLRDGCAEANAVSCRRPGCGHPHEPDEHPEDREGYARGFILHFPSEATLDVGGGATDSGGREP